MTQNLGNYLQGEILCTPPASIKHIRKEFDVYPELLRRSFYAYSNYLAAVHIKKLLVEKPVVLDRYWHSTTAYAIAKDTAFGVDEYLPEKGDECYEWPRDLMKPSAVVFLTTKEKERDNRMITREKTEKLTDEEHQMRKSGAFRKRISEVYRRIGLTDRWVEVDTSGTEQESLTKAINGLKEIGIL